MAQDDSHTSPVRVSTPSSAETDEDGDTIMQDSQPSKSFNITDNIASRPLRGLLQTSAHHPSFSLDRNEQAPRGTSQTSFQPHQPLTPLWHTDSLRFETKQNHQRSWTPFNLAEADDESEEEFGAVMQKSQRGTTPPPIVPSEHPFPQLVSESSVNATLPLADPSEPLLYPPYKRHRTTLSDAANGMTGDTFVTMRTHSSPTLPLPNHDRSLLNRRLPPLEFDPSSLLTMATFLDNSRSNNVPVGLHQSFRPSLPVHPTAPSAESTAFRGTARLSGLETESDIPQSTAVTSAESRSIDMLGSVFDHNHRPIATPVSRKRKQLDVRQVACTGCMDEFDLPILIRLPCQCRYCPECLNRLVATGCSSAADFPPKCHGQALRISTYGPALDRQISDRYKQVEAEFSTQTPQYCATPTCSAFIARGQIIESDDIGICSACSECTCTRCNALLSSHKYEMTRRICPNEGSDIVALRALGQRDGWMQCPACQIMIEKVDGCDHVACSCGVEFCFSCGSFYDEENLCECQSVGTDNDNDNDDYDDEHADGDGDEDSFDGEDRDDDGEDEEVWPGHHRIFDSMGRQKCWHLTTQGVEGQLCHGCLVDSSNLLLHSCRECHSELCQSCLDHVYDDHIKALDREHEDAVWKISSMERENPEMSLMVDAVAIRNNTTAASLHAHEASMVEKWNPHRIRRQETWQEHKTKMGLS